MADKQFVCNSIYTDSHASYLPAASKLSGQTNHSISVRIKRTSPLDTTAVGLLCLNYQLVKKFGYRLLIARENATLIWHDSLPISGL